MKIRTINFGYIVNGQSYSVVAPAPMYIPETTYTSAEISNVWSSVPGSASIEVLLDALDAADVTGGGFPSAFPGAYIGRSELENLPDYERMHQSFPYSVQLNSTFDSNRDWVIYYDNSNTGIDMKFGNQVRYIENGAVIVQRIATGVFLQLGLYAATERVYGAGLFITSDNRVGMLRIYLNKTNSVIIWFDVATSQKIIDWIDTLPIPPEPVVDPYEEGGTSEPGKGPATFNFTSTDIPVPVTPSISSSDTGFLTLYNPDSSQLKSLANYLWAGAWDINNFRKLFADPMDAILGCQIIPYAGQHPATTPSSLIVGNLSTGVNMPACTEQYFDVECGTVQILPKWGAYLDFSPYSSLALYLPYIGIVEISPDDCMNGSIRVVYRIDILSGSCCVFVYCTSNGGNDGHVLYTFNGSCACKVPVTAGQYGNILVETFKNVSTILNGAMIAGSAKGAHQAGAAVGAVTNAISSAASTTQNLLKPKIMRSGDIGGSAGIMGIQKPYLILTIPKMCIPGNQNTYIGYPSFVTMQMNDLTGYTQIEVTHLNNMSCTQEESDEIISLLGSGVIF